MFTSNHQSSHKGTKMKTHHLINLSIGLTLAACAPSQTMYQSPLAQQATIKSQGAQGQNAFHIQSETEDPIAFITEMLQERNKVLSDQQSFQQEKDRLLAAQAKKQQEFDQEQTNFKNLSITACNTPNSEQVIYQLSPGAASTGETVTITGFIFDETLANNKVNFGSTPATVLAASANSIQVVVPENLSGLQSLSVEVEGKRANSTQAFRVLPKITGLSKTTDTSKGGGTVVITGTGFTGASAVKFGNVNASQFEVNSPTQITAIVPPGKNAQELLVSVVTSAGNSLKNDNALFYYHGPYQSELFAGPTSNANYLYVGSVPNGLGNNPIQSMRIRQDTLYLGLMTIVGKHPDPLSAPLSPNNQYLRAYIAGDRTQSSPISVDGAASIARFKYNSGMVVDSKGNIFLNEISKIRKIAPNGNVSTFVGSTESTSFYADGQGHSAGLNKSSDITIDEQDNLYILDHQQGTSDNKPACLRKVTPQASVSTVGCWGNLDWEGLDFAIVSLEANVVYDSRKKKIFISDGKQIQSVSLQGGTLSPFVGGKSSGDGKGNASGFQKIFDMDIDPSGNIFVVDRGYVRKVNPAGDVTTIAGKGSNNPNAIDGIGAEIQIAGSPRIAVDANNHIYLSDFGRCCFTSSSREETYEGNTGYPMIHKLTPID